jgi:hypothetical protein
MHGRDQREVARLKGTIMLDLLRAFVLRARVPLRSRIILHGIIKKCRSDKSSMLYDHLLSFLLSSNWGNFLPNRSFFLYTHELARGKRQPKVANIFFLPIYPSHHLRVASCFLKQRRNAGIVYGARIEFTCSTTFDVSRFLLRFRHACFTRGDYVE